MKLKELKHNHSLTDLLKVLIFSILMITPLLSVATRCLYVICNKNAYQSYYGETINEEFINDLSYNDLKVGEEYTLNTNTFPYASYNTEISRVNYYFKLQLKESNPNLPNIQINTDYILGLNLTQANNTQWYFSNTPGSTTISIANNQSFKILLLEKVNTYNIDLEEGLFNQITYNKYSYLDNVFEYSVNKLAESPILSWTQQTAIYTGVSTMTTQLGVNTPTITMLIVYWFLLTVIYIIIDIIIKLFTWLTHMIGNKSV